MLMNSLIILWLATVVFMATAVIYDQDFAP